MNNFDNRRGPMIPAILQEIRIRYEPKEYFGPPEPLKEERRYSLNLSFKPEYKWQEPTDFSNYRQWSKR
jgi:hypothetical protein